jgi:hypothetical protein
MAAENNMGKAKIGPDVKSRTCVLVLGMHRSGTSALAGLFSKLGCDVPANQMAPSRSNERGFFESAVVRDFNDELLASTGSAWDDITPFHEDWPQSPAAPEFLERAVSVLEAEMGASRLFVLKDPRICRLVPFWTEALERFGCSVRPVLTIRNPLEVGRSLVAKKDFNEPLGQMLWLRHTLDAERDTRGTRRFHTSFEQLVQSWETIAERAEEHLQLVWPKSIANAEFEVAAFLSGELRHQKASNERALTSPLLPGWLREAYDIFGRWAADGELANDYPALDRIKAEFDTASRAFARFIQAERAAKTQVEERAQETQKASSALQEHLEGQLKASKAEAEALSELQEREATKRGEMETQLASAVEEMRREREVHRSELEHKSAELGQCSQDLEESRKGYRDLLAKFEVLDERHSAAEADLEALNGQIASLTVETEKLIGDLKASLQQERREKTLMDAELHELRQSKENLEEEFAASRARRKEMARVIKSREAKAGALNAELQERYRELGMLERKILRWSPSWWARRLPKAAKGFFRPTPNKALS